MYASWARKQVSEEYKRIRTRNDRRKAFTRLLGPETTGKRSYESARSFPAAPVAFPGRDRIGGRWRRAHFVNRR